MKVHDNKQWECDVCKKTFTTKYFLKKHKRLHTGKLRAMTIFPKMGHSGALTRTESCQEFVYYLFIRDAGY